MKIAIFHELDLGGARRMVDEFIKRLSFLDVNLYSSNFSPKIWKGSDWRTRLYKDTLELINLYKIHKKIAKDIDSKNYDFVLVHPSKYTQSPFLLRFLKTKSIYFCQEPLRMVYDPPISKIDHIKFPKNIYEFINRKIRKWIDSDNFKKASIVLVNSKYSKEFIEKSYGRTIQVCYLGVDANLFKPLDIDRTIDILYFGNRDESYELLINSLKLFNSKPKLYSIFRNENKRLKDEELVKIYNKSKILVALNKNEPFGLIPIEAMACGTVVVAVDEGGYKESIVDKKTGLLVSRNIRSLYKGISKLLSKYRLRYKLSKQAREHILENWTWDKSINRFLKIIDYEK